MPATRRMTLLLLTLLLDWPVSLAGPVRPQTGAFTCKAGTFIAGEAADVTCHFNRDVNQTMHHVYVTRYSFDSAKDYVDVIDCFRKRTYELSCKVEPGYEYNHVISDTMTFKIPKVSSNFEGRYGCSLVPPDGVIPNLCELRVKNGAPSVFTARPQPPQDTATQPTLHTSTDSKRPYVIGISIAGSIAALVVISVVIYFFVKYCRPWLPCHKKEDRSNAKQRNEKRSVGTSSFTPQQVSDLLSNMDFRQKFIGEMMVYGRCAGTRKLDQLLHQVYDHNESEGERVPTVSKCGPSSNDLELHTIRSNTEGHPFDVQAWLHGLPDDARNILITEGFDDMRVLQHATERDIDRLNLKQGHRVLVMAGLRSLQQQAGRTTYRSVQEKGKHEAEVDYSPRNPETVTLLPPVRETCDVWVKTSEMSEAEDTV